ncbi:MAG: GNAT family N-acetyltransferase [Chitinophaga sp.]|uniref:GNAT family N-acetyltransferase n=1 Tax=Chitinophaga sp. TaxID=1869181 RepID=UPI0025C2BB20|nr:GNAT family N-acetyltransferase [Chitinophaga sp.]MBV8253109.1 GNAT family N-acetyltransferase [Chitinophaga sp.]
MISFSPVITTYWQDAMQSGDLLAQDGVFMLTVNPALEASDRVMILSIEGGATLAAVTPDMARSAGLYGQSALTEQVFRQQLAAAGTLLNGADYLYYYTAAEKQAVLAEQPAKNIRLLTEADTRAFEIFRSHATTADLDGAFVELDHSAVFGYFFQDQLVAAASIYPWDATAMMDVGVLTLEDFRGKGIAKKLVRAIFRHAITQGYEPQYRCQIDNLPSVRLATAAGLTLLGKWEVVVD